MVFTAVHSGSMEYFCIFYVFKIVFMISNFPVPWLGHSDIGMVFTNTEKTRAKNQYLNNCTMIAFFQHLEAGKLLETALFEMPEALDMLLPVAWRLWNASSCGRRVLLRACWGLALPGASTSRSLCSPLWKQTDECFDTKTGELWLKARE